MCTGAFIWAWLFSVDAQKPQFSQYYASPLLIAPSFAGNSLGTRAFVNFRDQWANMPGSFTTYSLALDNNFYSINSGAGVVFLRDVAGKVRYGNTMAALLYSYRFNFNNEWRIRPGIAFSWTQHSIDFPSAIFPDQIWEMGISPATIEKTVDPYSYFDAEVSAVFYNRRMWFGLDVSNLMRPVSSFSHLQSRIPMQWTQFGGCNFRLNRGLGSASQILSVNYLAKIAQWSSATFYQFEVGANWIRSPLLLGVAWRGLPNFKSPYSSYDAVIITAGVAFGNFTVGYSYDFTVSSLGPATGGSHEVTLSFSFNEGNRNDRKSSIPCPGLVKSLMFGDKESYR
jgi:type IX secretion system PorP/SprF family membrane protein